MICSATIVRMFVKYNINSFHMIVRIMLPFEMHGNAMQPLVESTIVARPLGSLHS